MEWFVHIWLISSNQQKKKMMIFACSFTIGVLFVAFLQGYVSFTPISLSWGLDGSQKNPLEYYNIDRSKLRAIIDYILVFQQFEQFEKKLFVLILDKWSPFWNWNNESVTYSYDVLEEIPSNSNGKTKFIEEYRKRYQSVAHTLHTINEFNKIYVPEKAIWW